MKTVMRGLMRSKRVLSRSAWGGVGSAGCVEADGSTRLGPVSFGCLVIHGAFSEEFGSEHSH